MPVGVNRAPLTLSYWAAIVVPMPVGVNRVEDSRVAVFQLRCPHARGGEPLDNPEFKNAFDSCPHARGGEPYSPSAEGVGLLSCPHARGGEPSS